MHKTLVINTLIDCCSPSMYSDSYCYYNYILVNHPKEDAGKAIHFGTQLN